MKKLYIFFIIVIVILCAFCYHYYNNKVAYSEKKSINSYYEEFKKNEVNGAEIATLINKIENDNLSNEVQKDSNGLYLDNGTNSVTVELKFKDSDSTIHGEKIFNGGTDKFISLYSNNKFKCDNIEYHDKTKTVRYLHFTEI